MPDARSSMALRPGAMLQLVTWKVPRGLTLSRCGRGTMVSGDTVAPEETPGRGNAGCSAEASPSAQPSPTRFRVVFGARRHSLSGALPRYDAGSV